MRVGDLREGEVFVVVKHFRNGAPLWVYIRSQDRDLEGWIVSLPQDVYFIDTLPIRIEPLDFAVVATATILICFVLTSLQGPKLDIH